MNYISGIIKIGLHAAAELKEVNLNLKNRKPYNLVLCQHLVNKSHSYDLKFEVTFYTKGEMLLIFKLIMMFQNIMVIIPKM